MKSYLTSSYKNCTIIIKPVQSLHHKYIRFFLKLIFSVLIFIQRGYKTHKTCLICIHELSLNNNWIFKLVINMICNTISFINSLPIHLFKESNLFPNLCLTANKINIFLNIANCVIEINPEIFEINIPSKFSWRFFKGKGTRN